MVEKNRTYVVKEVKKDRVIFGPPKGRRYSDVTLFDFETRSPKQFSGFAKVGKKFDFIRKTSREATWYQPATL